MREDRGARAPGTARHMRETSPVLLPLPCHLAMTGLQHVDAMCAQQAAAFRQGFEVALLALGALSLAILGAVALWT